MKNVKRIFVITFMLAFIISVSSINAFAATVTQDNLEVTLVTDKEKYSENEQIKTTLTVKNNNDTAVTNVDLETALPDGYKLADKSENKKTVDSIAAGESVSLEVTLEKDNTKKGSTPSEPSTDPKSSTNPVSGGNSGNSGATTGGNNNNSETTTGGTTTSGSAIQTGQGLLFVGIALLVLLTSGFTFVFVQKRKTTTISFEKKFLSVFLCLGIIGSSVVFVRIDTNAAETPPESIIKDEAEIEILKKSISTNTSLKYIDSEIALIGNVTYYINAILDETDDDGDGVKTWIEELFKSSPNKIDTDGDGLTDYIEIYYSCTDPTVVDSNNNGIADGDEDFDNDGLTNIEEYQLKTSINNNDTDSDDIKDYEEIHKYKTDPLNEDTDLDGIFDSDEIVLGLNPLNPCTDGVTQDGQRKFTQSLDNSCIEESLLDEKNEAIPSLEADIPGVINRSVEITETNKVGFSDSRAICGKAIEINSDIFESGKITFQLSDSTSRIILDNNGEETPICTKMICQYNEDGNVEYLETNYDEGTNTISARITCTGTYFVMDVNSLFNELGLELPSVVDIYSQKDSKIDSSSVGAKDEGSNNQNNDNNSQKAKEEFVTSVSANDHNGDYELANQKNIKITSVASSSHSTMAQADVVFLIDTTGSMGDEIKNVKDNVGYFVDALKDKGISAGLALVEYKDIEEDGYNSTKVHTNGISNWFYNIDAYKSVLNSVNPDGGGDTPESAVDALETGRLLDMRASAGKIFVLVSDAGYKTGNRYGIPSMSAEIELLKNAGINCSVVTTSSEKYTYSNLYNSTGGIYANINGNFFNELMTIADKIGDKIVGDGFWIYLDGPVPVPVRLDEEPKEGSKADTDHDGIPDIEELESTIPSGQVDLDTIIQKVSKGIIKHTNYGIVNVYKYKSSPVEDDTDFDGIPDDKDSKPKDNTFTGRIACSDYDNEKGSISFTVDYRDFFKPKNSYQKNISVLSSLYACDIYDGNNIFVGNNVLTSRVNRKELLETFGLKDAKIVKVGYKDNDRTEIAIGHHAVKYNDKLKEVVLVSIRGTNGTFEEWSSNFDVGSDTSEYYALAGLQPEWKTKFNHKGFDITANRVINAVSDYLNSTSFADGSEVMFWVTGHSRGAGIANLVGAYLEKSGKDAVTYTFAAPTTTTSNSSYTSIYNLINTDDLIPTLPLEKWGFRRYGRDLKYSVSTYSSQKTFYGTYKDGPFTKMTGIPYDPNKKIDWLLDNFSNVASNRSELYHFSYEEDTLQLYGVNRFDYSSAKEKLDAVKNDISKNGEKPMLIKFGDFEVIEGTNGFGVHTFRAGCYQSPACFMQILADLAAGTNVHKVAGKYEGARNAFVVTYLSGMAHPHWTQTYYLLASGYFPISSVAGGGGGGSGW